MRIKLSKITMLNQMTTNVTQMWNHLLILRHTKQNWMNKWRNEVSGLFGVLPGDGEMNEMTLRSRHMIVISNPGCIRSGSRSRMLLTIRTELYSVGLQSHLSTPFLAPPKISRC